MSKTDSAMPAISEWASVIDLGLTKLQYAAIHIAAGFAANQRNKPFDMTKDSREKVIDTIASDALSVAELILNLTGEK